MIRNVRDQVDSENRGAGVLHTPSLLDMSNCFNFLIVIIRNLTDIHFVVCAVVVFLCYFNCICKLSGVWRSVLVVVCTKKALSQKDKNEKQK